MRASLGKVRRSRNTILARQPISGKVMGDHDGVRRLRHRVYAHVHVCVCVCAHNTGQLIVRKVATTAGYTLGQRGETPLYQRRNGQDQTDVCKSRPNISSDSVYHVLYVSCRCLPRRGRGWGVGWVLGWRKDQFYSFLYATISIATRAAVSAAMRGRRRIQGAIYV